MESFDICLKQWMAENEFPLFKLTAELGYKRKTTIARALSGQYTYKSCMKIYKDMQDRKLINAQWEKRFEDALRNVQRGKKESEILEAFRKSIMEAGTETIRSRWQSSLPSLKKRKPLQPEPCVLRPGIRGTV